MKAFHHNVLNGFYTQIKQNFIPIMDHSFLFSSVNAKEETISQRILSFG